MGMESRMAWRYFSCSRLLEESEDDAGAKKQHEKLIFSFFFFYKKLFSSIHRPVEEGFCDLNSPTTLLPWKPPERSSTAFVRGCFQQTTGRRLCL